MSGETAGKAIVGRFGVACLVGLGLPVGKTAEDSCCQEKLAMTLPEEKKPDSGQEKTPLRRLQFNDATKAEMAERLTAKDVRKIPTSLPVQPEGIKPRVTKIESKPDRFAGNVCQVASRPGDAPTWLVF